MKILLEIICKLLSYKFDVKKQLELLSPFVSILINAFNITDNVDI